MIKINVSRTCAEATQRERLTSGMQGVELSFSFSADWDDLVKTAVFEGSGRRIALTNIGDSCTIPHEVLAKHGGALRVGVYGRTADGSAATPTVYAQLGIIQRGADPNADPSTKPTLPVWAQILAKIGDLASLTTEDKTNLVAAINEAAKSGGGSGDGKDGTGIESITYKGKDEDGGNVYTVLLTDGTSYDITAPKGAKGDKGDTGATGPQGPAGAPGKDGAGMDITGATVGQIAKITAVDASGAPTAWEPVDMAGGGGGEDEYELVFSDEIQEDIGSYYRNTDMNGETFSLTDVAVVMFTKAFAESTNKFGRAISFVETGGWGRNVFAISDSLPKNGTSFGRYDAMRVKLVNGYQIRTLYSISQNTSNVFGSMEEKTSAGLTHIQFFTDQEKLFSVTNPKGFITCIKIVGYATPLISAGSIIKLYKRKGT